MTVLPISWCVARYAGPARAYSGAPNQVPPPEGPGEASFLSILLNSTILGLMESTQDAEKGV